MTIFVKIQIVKDLLNHTNATLDYATGIGCCDWMIHNIIIMSIRHHFE